MKIGDELLWINGRHLIGLSHSEAVELLNGTSSVVQLVIAREMVSHLTKSRGIFNRELLNQSLLGFLQ